MGQVGGSWGSHVSWGTNNISFVFFVAVRLFQLLVVI